MYKSEPTDQVHINQNIESNNRNVCQVAQNLWRITPNHIKHKKRGTRAKAHQRCQTNHENITRFQYSKLTPENEVVQSWILLPSINIAWEW